MIVYNITVKVEASIADTWLQWLLNQHVPEILSTGCFSSHRVLKLLEVDDSDGPTYAIQFTATSVTAYNKYSRRYAPLLRQKSTDKWGDSFTAFRSLMEVVE